MIRLKFLTILLAVPLIGFCQTEIKYFKKNWKPTSEKKSYYIRTIEKINDNLYFVKDSSVDNQVKKTGYYKSLEPEIEHGEFEFTLKKYNKIYKGSYINGELSGLWYKYDTIGVPLDTLDYDFTLTKVETNEIESDPDDEEVFFIVETMPKYKNGLEDFRKYLGDNLSYPPRATIYNIKGRVIVQFTIDTTGQVVNIEIVESVDKDLDKEAARVINNCEPWKPGEQRGVPVRVKFTVPLNFTFDD